MDSTTKTINTHHNHHDDDYKFNNERFEKALGDQDLECHCQLPAKHLRFCTARKFICLLLIIILQQCNQNAAAPSNAVQQNALALLNTPPSVTNTYNNNSSIRQKQFMDNYIQRQSAATTAPYETNRALKYVALSNKTLTCNDNTTTGFYWRKNNNSKKWVVFLEGGWHCYDEKTCSQRWNRLRHLMTSSQWPETIDVGGILSPSPEENPYWHSANHVLVPYCTSDSWSGTKITPEPGSRFRFMGALILRQVIADLLPLGLGRIPGAELMLAGSSAGGLGVMLNLDRITNFLQQERQLEVTVRGVSDSGWFLDREPYVPSAVASSEAVRQGWKMWQGQVPESCAEEYKSEPWRCYFGYRLYPTLKTPLFVFQWLFDEAQMRADNVASPVTPHEWNYIHAMGGALRSSLDNVTAVFAPSCIGHAVLSRRDWMTIKIDDISLPTALRCWEHSTRPRRKRHDKLKRSTEATLTQQEKQNKRRQHRQKQREENKRNPNANGSGSASSYSERRRLTKAEREERKRLRHEQQKRKEEKRNKRKENKLSNAAGIIENATDAERHLSKEQEQQQRHHRLQQQRKLQKRKRTEKEKQKRHQRQQKQKKRQTRRKEHNLTDPSASVDPAERELLQNEQAQRTTAANKRNESGNIKINRRSGVPRVPARCSLRLLERCSWPQCNYSCPTLTNPATGEEMRFLELLSSFGLDIEAVASALGVDMHTLNNMDRTELVHLLTQQVS